MFGNSDFHLNTYNLLLVIFVALGTLATAYGLAIIGSTAGQPNFYSYFNLATQEQPGYKHTTDILGALNGANSGGAFLGCIFSAWSADRFGRKRTIQISCAIMVVGGALNAGSVDLAMLGVGRAIAGFASGILAIVVPMYQGETATAETRGAMMAVSGVMYAWGYSLAGWLGYGCSFIPATSKIASFAWRFPLAFQCVPPLIVLAGSKFIPFSPRWLLAQDRREEAYQIIQRLHARKEDPNHIQAKEEYYLMETQYEADKKLSLHRSFEMFRTKANRKRALISMLLMVGDQFLGVYVLANYGVLIYAELGLKGNLPLLLNACWTTFTIFGNTFTALTVDKFGRRTFLLIGSIGCTLSLIFECALEGAYLGGTNQSGLSAAIFFIWFYILFWSCFMDATQYVYVSEIWPNHLRSQGTAWGLAWFFLSSEVTLVAAPIALSVISWKFYFVLICPSLLYIPTVYFMFPETKGRTLEEIGEIFGDKHVAAHWYGISAEEKERIAQNAMKLTQDGRIESDPDLKPPENDVEGKAHTETHE